MRVGVTNVDWVQALNIFPQVLNVSEIRPNTSVRLGQGKSVFQDGLYKTCPALQKIKLMMSVYVQF